MKSFTSLLKPLQTIYFWESVPKNVVLLLSSFALLLMWKDTNLEITITSWVNFFVPFHTICSWLLPWQFFILCLRKNLQSQISHELFHQNNSQKNKKLLIFDSSIVISDLNFWVCYRMRTDWFQMLARRSLLTLMLVCSSFCMIAS